MTSIAGFEPIDSPKSSSTIVPLAKYEFILGGVSCIGIIILGFVFEWWIDLTISFDHSAISTISQLNDFGDYVQNTRPVDSIEIALTIFGVLLFLFWYIALMRVLKICFTEYHGCCTVFSVCYVIFTIFIYLATTIGIVWQAFNWQIINETTNEIDPSSNMMLLFVFRLRIVCLTVAVYFGSIMMVAFWLPFILVFYFDLKYNNNVKSFLYPKYCNGQIAKITLILLLISTLIASYLFIYSWGHNGFWSLTGESQLFQMCPLFMGGLSGAWLIWFGISKNYQKFNEKAQFEQFI